MVFERGVFNCLLQIGFAKFPSAKGHAEEWWSLWVDLYWLMMAVAVDKDDHPQYQYSRGWVRVTKEIVVVVVSPWRRYYARRSMTADEDIPFVGETLSW